MGPLLALRQNPERAMTANSLPTEGRPPFVFAVDPTATVALFDVSDMLVRVPEGIGDSQSLFRCFESALRFPGYFGWNWDALRNCLLDLTWLDPLPIRIVVIHEGLPKRVRVAMNEELALLF